MSIRAEAEERSAAMRGHFSIEWMAQSSRPAAPPPPGPPGSESGPEACGTNAESLPGFYRRTNPGGSPGQEDASTKRRPGPEADLSTEEETSGYESEGSRSRSPSTHAEPAPSLSASPPAGRRPRTAFTAEQIHVLERAFKKNAYLGTQDKAELCRKLHLSDKQIRNWFQNRRMKLKRSVQDALAHACQASAASPFLHYPELQACRPGPYSRPPLVAVADAASYSPPPSLQYGGPLTGTSALSLDSFYPAVLLPPAHLRGSYPAYPQYY
ncbi:ventrally expressed dharma/bozozok antagonist [Oryzias melastigma]|uniref:ventrally expressed dharma/bozozok antagonist n=1 Tax=Oryzias melastigma TaxID=30732 RepID=UPI000CF82ADE|nr:ventrally expressed dharma/bozozok antagonist [Oryzias melastigma]